MKFSYKVLALATAAAVTYSILGCAAPQSYSYSNVGITISAACTDCPTPVYNPAYPVPAVAGGPAPAGSVLLMPNTGEGGTYTFTANVTNAPPNVTWTLYPTPNLTTPNPPPTGTSTPVGESGNSSGTIAVASGTTVYYSVPGPPVYSGAALVQANALGIPQGDVMLVASVPSNPTNPSAVVTASQLVQVYGGSTAQGPPSVYLSPKTPTTPAGLVNPVVTVTHGAGPLAGQYQFYGGVVGAAPCTTTTACAAVSPTTPIGFTDNAPIWEVGPAPFSLATAIPGGNAIYGTISSTGLYTAPATIPPTQPVVIIVSHLVPTVDAYANIAIN